MKTESEQMTRVIKARISLITTEPFFGQLLLNLKTIEMSPEDTKEFQESGRYPTFCTNGVYLWFNPEFCKTLNDIQLRTVLIHEVMHPMLLHIFRRGERDPVIWNMACDYLVNNMIVRYIENSDKSGRSSYFCPLTNIPIDGGKEVFNWVQDFKYENMTAEEVYEKILKNCKKIKIKCLVGEFTDGTSEEGGTLKDKNGNPIKGLTGEQIRDLEEQWKNNAIQAAITAKEQGKLPGNLEKLIDGLLEPKVSWQEVLRQFIKETSKDEYNWMKPNKRMLAQRSSRYPNGLYFPSLHSEVIGHICCVIDSSGSTWPILDEFVSEIQAIMDLCKPIKLTLIECDDGIQQVHEYEPGDLIEFNIKGCGGTSFIPAFNYIDEMDDKPLCTVYLTDLEGSFPKEEPEYPVLWVIKNSREVTPPWGDTVYI